MKYNERARSEKGIYSARLKIWYVYRVRPSELLRLKLRSVLGGGNNGTLGRNYFVTNDTISKK